jgi:hypothetical protein
MEQHITPLTRRNIADELSSLNWAGRMPEPDFLSRIFDLAKMPSTDGRFPNAYGDIHQHRINNYDWQDDWVFYDARFALMTGDDETLLRFLCETIHPVVRPDAQEVEKLLAIYNDHLRPDGYQLFEQTRMSGRPVYAARYVGVAGAPAIAAAKTTLAVTDPGYVAQQITRMEAAVYDDPGLAIGTAKELLESCAKTILAERSIQAPKDATLPQLVKLAAKELELTPDDVPDSAKGADTIRRLLGNLGTIAQSIAELRNQYGTGHGKTAGTKGLSSRHAKLAAGAAATLATFLVETHLERRKAKME